MSIVKHSYGCKLAMFMLHSFIKQIKSIYVMISNSMYFGSCLHVSENHYWL